MNDTATPPATPPAEKPTDETIKETFESIIIAFVLAFVFRAYVVEAFVIPTGSMAPTLLGEHVVARCDQCGYRFSFDPDPRQHVDYDQAHRRALVRPYLTQKTTVICPMCNNPVKVPAGTRISSGDRILVHKYIYSLSEPQRWDVVVFKNPQGRNSDGSPGPSTNFIKRLIGLPGDSVWIIDGNIYARPAGRQWQIARKTDREKVQRDVWQPIYHSSYVPLDLGHDRPERGQYPWVTPWVAARGEGWDIEGKSSYSYPSSEPGEVLFDFSRLGGGRPVWYAYNQAQTPGHPEPIEDIRVAASFQPSRDGLSVELHTSARLDDTPPNAPPHRLIARIEADGTATLSSQIDGKATPHVIAEGHVAPFRQGDTRRVELWFVDQELSLWVDGQRVLAHPFDITSIELAKERLPLRSGWMPDVGIRVAGSPVTMHEVELDRDIYYISGTYENPEGGGGGKPATGVLIKSIERDPDRTEHVVAEGEPIQLEADQFFCLGDNSPRSQDGRYWTTIDPWIEARMLAGNKQHWGVVPRKLMMGRAFFVYFPAPFGLSFDSRYIIPNFADMRFIH
ncbi:MAG: signal peptidase I [Planctomycetes bacterium]|nr:signal peptidase I [Planctomycetota bacterium]